MVILRESMNLMIKRKYEVKKPRAKKTLAAIIAEQFAKKGPTPFLPDQVNKAVNEKERRCLLSFCQRFYLDDILVKCIYKEEDEKEKVHD